MRFYVGGKIHGIRVTEKALEYEGSQTLPASLMTAADIRPYEQVTCVNKHNGARWVTYAIPGPEGECILNGAAARMGEIGDELLIFTFRGSGPSECFLGARVAYVGEDNQLVRVGEYESA